MSLLRSHHLVRNCLILHQKQGALCVAIDFQQRRHAGLYQKYENFLERRYPKVYKVHRLIVDGCRSCGSDIKSYFKIRSALSSGKRSLSDLTEAELFSYIQCPPEIFKLVAIICILQVPGPGELLIVAAIFFPRFVLTRHFWTEDQKKKFWQQFYKDSHKPRIQELNDFVSPKYVPKTSLPANDLNAIKLPDLNDLDLKHLFHIFRLHNISLFSGTNGLKKHAALLAQLDSNMIKEPELIDKLTDNQLRNHFYVRRLDFSDKSTDEMRQSLRDWTNRLKNLSNDPTLYLHAPVLCKLK